MIATCCLHCAAAASFQPPNIAPHNPAPWREAVRGRIGCHHCDRHHAPAPPPLPPDLAAALYDLNRIPNTHPAVLDNVRWLIKSLYRISPAASPSTPKTAAKSPSPPVLHAPPSHISCHPDNSVACNVNAQKPEDDRCARYSAPRPPPPARPLRARSPRRTVI